MPPYGFDIDDELHDQLRAPVPPGVMAWVERQTKCQVIAQRLLEGGQSAAIHRLVLDDRSDVILQRFVLDWIRDEAVGSCERGTGLRSFGRYIGSSAEGDCRRPARTGHRCAHRTDDRTARRRRVEPTRAGPMVGRRHRRHDDHSWHTGAATVTPVGALPAGERPTGVDPLPVGMGTRRHHVP